MQRPSLFSNRSFRLLLYLEWILLGITLLGAIRPAPHREISEATLPLTLLTLLAFGAMGFKLPMERTRDKVLYTAIEFGLLFFTFLLDGRTISFPLLGLIIVIRSCLIFAQTNRVIVAGLVLATFLLMLFQRVPEPRRPHRVPPILPSPDSFAHTILSLRLNVAITFGLTLLFTLLLVNALLAERESRKKLLIANDQLRQYALRIQDQATLQERNRIAREIHDALGHVLTAQSIQLENAMLFLPAGSEKTKSFLQEAKQLGSRALQEVRRSISTLRANPLQGQSLTTAIDKAVQDFYQTTGIQPKYQIQLSHPISVDISTTLYRIIQESLTNIWKHSQATQVHIHLEEQAETIQLRIEDNGQGFDPTQNTTGFGLQGMRERSIALGGKFALFSQPQQGCQILVSVPLHKTL
ncbi:MAG TPA: sensor histidine kinase [Trichocoleus sp.]|jgi:signal transduction histidine kinase